MAIASLLFAFSALDLLYRRFFREIMQSHHASSLPAWGIPLIDAARLAYETMERLGIDDMTRPGYSSADVPLRHFQYLLVAAAGRGEITLYGRRPPSRQSLPIPMHLMSQLQPEGDTNSLVCLSRSSPVDYHDVWLSRRHLKRAIRTRVGLLERVNRGLAAE